MLCLVMSYQQMQQGVGGGGGGGEGSKLGGQTAEGRVVVIA